MRDNFLILLEDMISAISDIIFVIIAGILTVIFVPIKLILKIHSSWEKCPKCRSRAKTIMLSSEKVENYLNQIWCCQTCEHKWYVVYKEKDKR